MTLGISTYAPTRTRTIQAWPVAERITRASADDSALNALSLAPSSALDAWKLPDCGETVGGHCVLRALLGQGNFGRVFAAEDEQTGQQVALKVVGLRRYPREYAEHELRALAAIAHPNVVQLNEHGVESNAREPYLWYTMPLYHGLDLSGLLASEGSLSLARAHAIFTRIAGGVCEMHRLGLRHQDIKPDNIYLATMAGVTEHHPVLLDLGGAARENATSPLVATFPFAAPEQAEALIGGLLGEAHPPLTDRVDVYALAATLLFSLIGVKFVGHGIGQNGTADDTSPAALGELRARLSPIYAARVRHPLPAGALPHVTGAARERLSRAFGRWLALDPSSRPSARGFVDELSVLLEWDVEVARKRAARDLRRAVFGVAGGLSLAACVGAFVGYEWHERTMGKAEQATSAALSRAARASDELHRASTNLNTIIADPSLGAVDKARKITEVVVTLEAQNTGLLAANAELRKAEKEAADQARTHAQQERAAFDAALSKAHGERDRAQNEQSLAATARWQAEAERDQARSDQAAADNARLRSERERFQMQQEKVVAEGARSKAESERDQAEQDRRAAELARQKADAERDRVQQIKSAEVAAAFAKGVEAGTAARSSPAPAPSQ